jgi:hypothetical protein
MVKVNSMKIFHYIVDEGASASVLSSSTWQDLGSPRIASTTTKLLSFERIPNECLGIVS